jgi:hypothetical protein
MADHAEFPGNFRRVRIILAREPAHTDGSRDIGYELVIPLTSDGKIDPASWQEHRTECRFVRFRPDQDDEIGHLVRRPGGAWGFHYDVRGDEEDGAGFHFEDERFVVGEYVSIRDETGMHTYIVSAVSEV